MNVKNCKTSLAGAIELLHGVHQMSHSDSKERFYKVGNLSVVLRNQCTNNDDEKLDPSVGPVKFYHSVLSLHQPEGSPYVLSGRTVVIISNEPLDTDALPRGWHSWRLMEGSGMQMPRVVVAQHHHPVEISNALEGLSSEPDAVIFMVNGANFAVDAMLGERHNEIQMLHSALFITCKQLFANIRSGKTRFATLVCNAWSDREVLNPLTGIFGGFIKSLARDVPDGYVAAVNTDSHLSTSLSHVEMA